MWHLHKFPVEMYNDTTSLENCLALLIKLATITCNHHMTQKLYSGAFVPQNEILYTHTHARVRTHTHTPAQECS